MFNKIKLAIEQIDNLSKVKPIKIISHLDTDGITAAAIFSKAFSRWNKNFSIQIVKNLEDDFVRALPEDHVLIFLDLGSGSLNVLKEKKTEVFIFDHHEIVQDVPANVFMVNPVQAIEGEPLSGAGVAYFFAKALDAKNRDLANLAVIGMVGDLLEKKIGKYYTEILKDSESIVKKGILIYPSTRPIDKALEYSSNPYIPGVTGAYLGVAELLRESGIKKSPNGYKSSNELTEEEMSSLITGIMLRCGNEKCVESLIGNIFLVKFFGKLEDARELSALINACSRMGHHSTALGLCMGNKVCKEQAEKIYISYKQHLVSALKYVSEMSKISGNKYTIINAQDKIKDTIIGTVTSIISHSPSYKEGTIIIALAYNEDKIKVSARLAGREGANVREVLSKVMVSFGGEVGGHPNAAGCLIDKTHEERFIQELQKVLEIEAIKV